MYSTCLHCHVALGRNELIEHFPIGRRLAFDPAKGRLWVVCTRCRRWNLTPVEERWEAIEECERRYRGTRLRASTENIGLAGLAEGLEIIRIGKPLLPEIAAWRYTGSLRRRWMTRGLPLMGGSVLLANSAIFSNLFIHGDGGGDFVVRLGAFLAAQAAVGAGLSAAKSRMGRARIVDAHGTVQTLKHSEVDRSYIVPTPNGWGLRIPSSAGTRLIQGPPAVHALRAVMTAKNFGGARQAEIGAALALLADSGDSSTFIQRLARVTRFNRTNPAPPDVTLALEMALHNDVERRAMEGELEALTLEWALAEEIAGIADDMFLPAAVRRRHGELQEHAR